MEENKDLNQDVQNEEKGVTEEKENTQDNAETVKETVKETIKVVCPHCQQEIEVEIERPMHTGTVGRRGKLQGLKLEEMSDDQLKVEIVNSKSVLYKAKKRGAASDIITKNEDRVNAAEAEKAKREAKVAAEKVVKAEDATTTATDVKAEDATATDVKAEDAKPADESVYNDSVENEI